MGRVSAPIFENEGNRLRQARALFFFRTALAISAQYLRAVSNIPVTVPPYDSSKLVVHLYHHRIDSD